MTKQEVLDYISTQLQVPVTQVQKLHNSFSKVLDFVTESSVDDVIPDWNANLTFNTDGSGAGRYCTHPDMEGKKRIFETKIDNNTGNEPPTDPDETENASWEEISQSSGSGIKEWAPGIYGAGLVIVYHSHSTLGRLLCILIDPARPFNSTDIEAEITAGKWDFINLPNASETVAGKVEEATATEAQNGTATGATGARLFINPAKLASWWTWIKTQAQTIAAMWTFADVRLTNQAASAGTFRGLIVDENGKILKEANVIYDPVTKEFKLKAVNVLATGYTLVIVDSNDEIIARFRNDKSLELGGTSAILEVNEGIESGNAAIRFLAFAVGSGLGFRFQDRNLNDYLNFRSLESDRAVVLRQALEMDFNQGEKSVVRQYTVTTDAVADGETVVFEFELLDNDHYDIKVDHAEATATNGNSITKVDHYQADVRKMPSTNIEGNTLPEVDTIASSTSRLPSTITTGGFLWKLDEVEQKIQFVFKNTSTGPATFVIWVQASYVKRVTPVLE